VSIHLATKSARIWDLIALHSAHQFHRPLGDSARRIRVADDLAQRERRDHRDWVGLEVVTELAPCKHHRVEELLDLRVSRLGLGQHLADVVHGPLDWQGVTLLCTLHHDDRADYLSGCGDVEV
jgi:hypothetical protein